MSEADHDFERRRKSHLQALDQAMGISSERLKQLDGTIGRGIQRGHTRFTPHKPKGPDSSYGVLESETKDGVKRKDITDSGEAAYLASLQQKADRKRT